MARRRKEGRREGRRSPKSQSKQPENTGNTFGSWQAHSSFTLPRWEDSLHDRASHCRVHKTAAASRLVFIHRSLNRASAQLSSRGICQTDQTNRAAMNNWAHQCLWLKERGETETHTRYMKGKKKERQKDGKMSSRCSFCLSWFHATF